MYISFKQSFKISTIRIQTRIQIINQTISSKFCSEEFKEQFWTIYDLQYYYFYQDSSDECFLLVKTEWFYSYSTFINNKRPLSACFKCVFEFSTILNKNGGVILPRRKNYPTMPTISPSPTPVHGPPKGVSDAYICAYIGCYIHTYIVLSNVIQERKVRNEKLCRYAHFILYVQYI